MSGVPLQGLGPGVGLGFTLSLAAGRLGVGVWGVGYGVWGMGGGDGVRSLGCGVDLVARSEALAQVEAHQHQREHLPQGSRFALQGIWF